MKGLPAEAGGTLGRLSGCLWLVVAGLGFLFVVGAAGVGIDASVVLAPLLLLPLAIAVLVFVAGNRVEVLTASALMATVYTGLGVWNYLASEDFERANSGLVAVSGGATSLTFVLLTFAIGAWSLGAISVIRRRSRQ